MAEQMPVVLSWGMGVDSTTILLRWLEDPLSRDFALSNLLVLSAQVGEEFQDTKRLAETHVLPRLRRHGIRYAQVARTGSLEKDGIVALSDTRQPMTCHIEGAYRLSDELLAAGTVPQYRQGNRRRSLKHKGYPLDTFLAREFGDRPFRHVIGFNADELRRVERDRSYSTAIRHSEYPLVEWGWGRKTCESYLEATLGEPFSRSCCKFCPFSSGRGRVPILRRYKRFPDAGAFAIFLEAISLALNPRMSLYPKGQRVADVIAGSGNAEALRLAEARLAGCEWALYRVQRIYYGKCRAYRKVSTVERGGSRREMLHRLEQMAASPGRQIDTTATPQTPRLYLRQRGKTYPTVEDFFVAAPAFVQDKCRPTFERRWGEVMGRNRQLTLFSQT